MADMITFAGSLNFFQGNLHKQWQCIFSSGPSQGCNFDLKMHLPADILLTHIFTRTTHTYPLSCEARSFCMAPTCKAPPISVHLDGIINTNNFFSNIGDTRFMALKFELSFYAAIDVIQGPGKAGSTSYEDGNMKTVKAIPMVVSREILNQTHL